MKLAAVVAFTLALTLAPQHASAQGGKLPADVVDAFHAALKKKDTAVALSLLDRGLVVFEFGVIDATAETYAFQHLRFDIDFAAATNWTLTSRRIGGEGNDRWVLSTYQVTGTLPDGKKIDQTTLETAIVRRAGDQFRIVHLHWSTNDSANPAQAQPAKRP